MTSIDILKDALRALSESEVAAYAAIVATADQVETLKVDAYRNDTPPVPEPWGKYQRNFVATLPTLLGKPVHTLEVGADTSAVPAPFLDLRSL